MFLFCCVDIAYPAGIAVLDALASGAMQIRHDIHSVYYAACRRIVHFIEACGLSPSEDPTLLLNDAGLAHVVGTVEFPPSLHRDAVYAHCSGNCQLQGSL